MSDEVEIQDETPMASLPVDEMDESLDAETTARIEKGVDEFMVKFREASYQMHVTAMKRKAARQAAKAKKDGLDIDWTDEQLAEAGIDKAKLLKLVKKLKECSKMLKDMGFMVYGESGHGNLIHESRPEHTGRGVEADYGAIVAKVGHGFDGGGW